ncbi:MAG: DsbA family protein [Pseudomonadota bacterium]|nr:DsbA family protein [Pseudomonadota bacterium]
MTLRFLAPAALALALAACGSNPATDTNGTAPAAPVASAKPPAGKAWTDVVSATPDGGFVMGNPAAPAKLIEFGSRLCPFCAKFDAEGFPALKAGPIASGKMSYEFRDYPVHGAADLGPIVLGQCVDAPIFFPLLDQMMTDQQKLLGDEASENALFKNVGTMQQAGATPAQIATTFAEKAGYLAYVKQRGVSEAKALACLNDPKAYEKIAKRADDATQKYQITGTPSFVLNGTPVDLGPSPDWAHLKPHLDAAGVM